MQRIQPNTVEEAVEKIIPYLQQTGNTAHKAIYFDGWRGMAASVVLRTIAKEPPPSLLRKFDKIIHLDCSVWKSRRALQRTIAQELKLPLRVMDILDREDEEDDFNGVDEGFRAEIGDVGAEIYGAMREDRCLVVFNNGSENTVDLSDFGIPLSVWGTRVLWTFRGRLRLNSEMTQMVDRSHLDLYIYIYSTPVWNSLLQNEASEIVGYTNKLNKALVEYCCLYFLSLNHQGGNLMDYNWVTHASSYWVCDGIVQADQVDEAWELAASLHRQIHMADYSSNALPSFGGELETPLKRWILARDNSFVHPESTSFFLVADTSKSDPPLTTDMFQQSDKLRVLKLCNCTFSFSSPPFSCCQNLRFLGLDCCKDQLADEIEKQGRPAVDFFKSLWVLDICYTDWELNLSPDIIEQMATNIKQVHIKKGRFWHINFPWRQLQNLCKLRVIQPTCPWETGQNDEFDNMVKMEFLDLSGNTTIRVMPSLSEAIILKILVLDGCVGLEHIGPEGLPPLLESFNFDVSTGAGAKISHICLSGCAKLVKFRICGSLPNLEELDLSSTKVKTLDLTTKLVQVPSLERVMLLGCEQLRAVLWPRKGVPQLSLLWIDTRGGEKIERMSPDLDKSKGGDRQAFFATMDMKSIQLLVKTSDKMFWNIDTDRFSLNICISATASGQWFNREKMGSGSSGKICRPPSLIRKKFYDTYVSVMIEDITNDHGYHNGAQFQALGYHVEIGEGISNPDMERTQGMKSIVDVMNKTKSLLVHNNSSLTTVIPEHTAAIDNNTLGWCQLKQCHVMKCPKMHTVFITDYRIVCFQEIDTFWAADLLMAHSIWIKGRVVDVGDTTSFAKLQSIHLYSCPRLKFVLPLSWNAPKSYFPELETLHIVNCGDLSDVFPVEAMFLTKIATDPRKGVLEFPKLKKIYLHELPKLQNICEAKMFTPKLESIKLRGCWSLRQLPTVGQDNQRRRHPVVDCEKDWWEKLEWHGLMAGHHPSLFEPRHSSYYKKPLPRVSVLR